MIVNLISKHLHFIQNGTQIQPSSINILIGRLHSLVLGFAQKCRRFPTSV